MPGKRLRIALNGSTLGYWSVRAARHELRYDERWYRSSGARPLSLSLPLLFPEAAHRGPSVEHWFDNLLPDDPTMRRRLAQAFGAASGGVFDLLAEIGRDCVGAVQLLPADSEPAAPGPATGRALDEAAVAALLRAAAAGLLPRRQASSDFRLSLAGAQEKTALLRIGGEWLEPEGTTPTTHILKLPLGRVGASGIDLSTSVANEWLCARLCSALGLEVGDTSIARFEELAVLVVERFDRRLGADGKTWLRRPQEDGCQVFGLPPERKYEADGGPGIERLMTLLAGARDAAHDRYRFFKTQVLFWLLGAPDGHAKNFSVFLEAGGRYSLTPLYDVISAWPYVDGGGALSRRNLTLAMGWHGKNRHYRHAEILPRHMAATAERCDFATLWPALVDDLRVGVPRAIERVARELDDEVPERLASAVFEGTTRALARLVRG